MPRYPTKDHKTFQVRSKKKEGDSREYILGETTKEALRRNFEHKKGDPDYFICEIEVIDGVTRKVEGSEEMI